MQFRFLLPVLLAGCAFAQSGTVPAAYGIGPKLPSTCNVGDLFFLTGTFVGHNLYGCAVSNGWALEGIGSGIVKTPTTPPPSTTPTTTASVSWSNPPAGLSVSANQNLAITFDRSATWSLQSGSRGSLSVSGNTVTYGAPSVKAQNAVAGCQVLPADSIFSTPITNLPVHAQSAAWISESTGVGTVGVSFGEAWGHNVVDNTVAPIAMKFFYSSGLNGSQYPLLTGNDRNREGGAITDDGGVDHHMVTINHQTCHFYETYQDYLTGLTPGSQYTANSGYDYTSTSYTQPQFGTTDAGGLPIYPLTVHLSEWEAGAINHALRFTSCAGCISNTPMWPATGSTAYTPTGAPMGSRWRLKSSYNISGFSPQAQVMLKALQQYGMFLADIGGMQQVQVDDDINQDPALNSALYEIQQASLTQSDFDIVDESSLMTIAASNRTNPRNGYVKPANFAQINGTDGNGNTLTIPIAVQPVLIGTANETLQIQAGQPYQLSVWVNNASNTGVSWSIASGPGSINSSGLYTPPATVASPVPFVITATSVEDPTATLSIRGNIIPSGTIRLDVGGPTPYVDSKGNTWMADTLGIWSGSYNNDNETYPGSKWGSLTDWFLYGWDRYTWGDDLVYGPFVVPNGTYSVQFMFAEGGCSPTFNPAGTFDGGTLTSGGVYGVEANGVMTSFNFGQTVNDVCLTPGIATVSATVTNNLLTVAVRATGGDGTHTAPFLNALEISQSGN
jgi:hypothetical protein